MIDIGSESTFEIAERNRRVKKCLEITYPGVEISVTAGRGTARHWIYIRFGQHVENPAGMLHNDLTSAIEDLIVGQGIPISKFPRDDAGRDFGMLPCINITNPRAGT